MNNPVRALPCSSTVSLAEGSSYTIQSPNFGGYYPNKAYCWWDFKVQAGVRPRITCDSFDTECGSEADSLVVKSSFGARGSYCGLSLNDKYILVRRANDSLY